MRMMLLLFLDDIKSERELMRIIPERLDYLWFLGYGLDDEIPDHSVLSKARKRWGQEVFVSLFSRVVHQWAASVGSISRLQANPRKPARHSATGISELPPKWSSWRYFFHFVMPQASTTHSWICCPEHRSNLNTNVCPGSRTTLLPSPVSVRNH